VEGNAHGGFLELRHPPPLGAQAALTNLLSRETTMVRVVSLRRSRQGTLRGIAVEFLAPTEAFWGVTFRLKKATSELRDLEREIKSGGVDPRVLREFRDAVDYVRKTAWAVQEWQERQLQQRDTATVLPLLTAERIRRVTQLSRAIVADLEAHAVTPDSAGIADLLRAIERLHEHLLKSLKEPGSAGSL
jgi:hypothetical protein